MTTEKKIYITAPEMAEMLGVSLGHAYKIIIDDNSNLSADIFNSNSRRGTSLNSVPPDA